MTKKNILIGILCSVILIGTPCCAKAAKVQASAESEISPAAIVNPPMFPELAITGNKTVIIANHGTQVYHTTAATTAIQISQGTSVSMGMEGSLGADFLGLTASIGVATEVTYTAEQTIIYELVAGNMETPNGYYRLETVFPGCSVAAYYIARLTNGMTIRNDIQEISYMPRTNAAYVRCAMYSDAEFKHFVKAV
ncbi:MAG: hypothetical protein J6D37_08715 [Clostridia bacterium]|nr:hypothetical protein [Clostridia bacterium]